MTRQRKKITKPSENKQKACGTPAFAKTVQEATEAVFARVLKTEAFVKTVQEATEAVLAKMLKTEAYVKTVQEAMEAVYERMSKTIQETMEAGFERMLKDPIVQNYAIPGNTRQPATVNISSVKHFLHSDSGKNIINYDRPQQMAAEPYASNIKRMADRLTNVVAHFHAKDSEAAEFLQIAQELNLIATKMSSGGSPTLDPFATHKPPSFAPSDSHKTGLKSREIKVDDYVMCGSDGLGNKKRSKRHKVKADWRGKAPTDNAMSEERAQTAVKEQQDPRPEDDFKRFRSNRAGRIPLFSLADASRNRWLWPDLWEQTETRQLGLHDTDYNEERNDFKIRILQRVGVHDKENDAGHKVRIFKTEEIELKNSTILRRKAPDGAVCQVEEVVVGRDLKGRLGSCDGLEEKNYSN